MLGMCVVLSKLLIKMLGIYFRRKKLKLVTLSVPTCFIIYLLATERKDKEP